MARFIFSAQGADGQTISGTLEAADRNAALQSLSEHYPLVTKLSPLRVKRGWFKSGPSKDQVLTLFQQLSVATAAGVPLKAALDTMREEGYNTPLTAVVFSLSTALSGGSSLSEAMLNHPEAFEKYQCMLVRAGESSGRLTDVLGQLALDMENRETLTNQVRSAIAYPAFVLGVAFLMAGGMLAFGVPQIKGIFDSMDAQLPLPTQILVWLGASFSTYWFFWVALLGVAIWMLPKAMMSPRVRESFELFLLNMWPFGAVYRTLNVAVFARTLGLLYRSGLTLSSAMDILTDTTSTVHMNRVLNLMKSRLLKGESLSVAMRATGYFPSMAIEMVATGENSGSLDKMLAELDRFYTRRCEVAMKSVTSLIEPALTVVVGILLGGIILGLALPFLNLPSLLM